MGYTQTAFLTQDSLQAREFPLCECYALDLGRFNSATAMKPWRLFLPYRHLFKEDVASIRPRR